MLWKVQASALPRSPRAGVPAGPGLSAHQALPLTDVGGPAPDTTEPVTLVGGRCGGVGEGRIQASRLQPCSPRAVWLSSVFHEALRFQ